jgi:hypothetical protein
MPKPKYEQSNEQFLVYERLLDGTSPPISKEILARQLYAAVDRVMAAYIRETYPSVNDGT